MKFPVMAIGNKYRPTPPTSSYWAQPGLTREQLNSAIVARRAQQHSATVTDITHDPSLAATLALKRDHWKEK